MTDRRDYEMTQDDLDALMSAINAARNAPLIMLQTGSPISVQEVANHAWKELGLRMGFDGTTARPNGKGDRFFSAVPSVQP